MPKDKILINGDEHVSIEFYLSMPECPWINRVTVPDKICNEGFPSIKRGKLWYINLKQAELWHKRRDKQLQGLN